MCGIYAIISNKATQLPSSTFERALCNRGPDHHGRVKVEPQHPENPLYVTLQSTVLSLRGDELTEQPLVDDSTGSILCWNGEAWKINHALVHGNDGQAVLKRLLSASKDGEEALLEALRSIDGPFAFVFLNKPANRLYYGRDRLGRRSLLVKVDDAIQLSSISDQGATGWKEVEADGFYKLHLDPDSFDPNQVPTRLDWTNDDALISSIGQFNSTVPKDATPLNSEAAAVDNLTSELTKSLTLRASNVPIPPSCADTDARVAILFSGGLDCTVLARMLSDILPANQSVDLLNVAFENPRVAANNKDLDQQGLFELCPDRITGRKSFEELSKVAPARLWRFVAINIPYTETTAHRKAVIDLICPHNTEMDLSIAYALYFAARGAGFAQTNTDSTIVSYATTARVLMSGLGADELFGGYIRHETAFRRQSYQGLIDELRLDVGRLGKRNLGRDDRAMANWGREVRFPFLDESLVRWAIQAPVWQKCNFGHTEEQHGIEPGKRVLRLLARDLGLVAVATEKKRAIQFGARTAKMESGRVKGTTLIS